MLNTSAPISTTSTTSSQSTTSATSSNAMSTTNSTSTLPATTSSAAPSPTGPITVTNLTDYNYLGCYSEGSPQRALTGLTPPAPVGGFTVELCSTACYGYTYFGVEYGNQCYCGQAINAGSVNQSSSIPSVNGCSMTCSGDQGEYCGGKLGLPVGNVYVLTHL